MSISLNITYVTSVAILSSTGFIYTVNEKKNNKMLLSYLLQNSADSDKIWCLTF